ncbi:hypothetical protein VI817_010212 [Penicillium citrinum]|nr:hypothetical protein VI817_010212 [Penicillium citrinum]
MWREPSEAETIKSTLEKDSSAAARSSIRRQPTIRRASRHASRARGAGVLSSLQSQLIDEIHRDYGIGNLPTAVRSPVLNIGVSEDGLDLDTTRREALNRPSTSARPNQPRREPPVRRSRGFRSHRLADLPLHDILRPSESRPSERSSSPSLTPNFAPAVYHRSGSPHPSTDGLRLAPIIRTDGRTPEPTSRIPSILLRDHQSGTESPRPQESGIDGLGDRQRSLSPDNDRDDAWEALVSTIAPDATLPSTDTSFSSNSASATDASRQGSSYNSAVSSQAPSSSLGLSRPLHLALDPYPDHLNPCEFPSDDEDTPVNYHRVLTPSGLQIPLRRSPGIHSTTSGHPPIPTISFAFSDASVESEVHRMRGILERLRRQDEDESRRGGLSGEHQWFGVDL